MGNISDNKFYKFRVEDGWLQFDKHVYDKIQEYFCKVEYPSILDFFEENSIRPDRVSRIVKDENRATVFTEKIAIEIYTFDEYFVLNNYKSYKMIDENGKENPFLYFD